MEKEERRMQIMRKKMNDKGLSLMELIVAIAIMAVLIGIMAPMMIKHVAKARQVKVEKEASEFTEAARIAYVEVVSKGKGPGADSVKNKTKASSPYYKGGTQYGNLTNWTVHNGVVATASNAPFAEELFSTLGISYGAEWTSKSSSIPISSSQPKMNPAGSLTKECIFQLFYDKEGNMIVEYSREGYFVRMENSLIVESVKIRNSSDKFFTAWQ